MAPASGQADGGAAPIYGVTLPPGYRDWTLISVAHVGGNLNDLRAKLGNDVAIKAYREGKLPFPDGPIIAVGHSYGGAVITAAAAGNANVKALVVIGVHTPEFGFEHDIGNVRRALKKMRVEYPIAVANDYAIWNGFENQYWGPRST